MSNLPPPSPHDPSFGGVAPSPPPSSPTQTSDSSSSDIRAMLASRGERFAGLVLEFVLVFVTLGIGWLFWSLIVWKDGLTPAKQILKMRVMRLEAREPASWAWMALRQAGIGIGLGIADGILAAVVGLDGGGLLALAFLVITVVMIFTSDLNQTLSDRIVGTVVVKEDR